MSLFTIGHSTHPREKFRELLEAHRVEYVLDVRSAPYSRYSPQYNREELKRYLESCGIVYAHMGRFFGARRDDRSLYTGEGWLDFEAARDSELFRTGMNNVMKGLDEGHSIVLMCTEKDPFDCHRAIMVARGFALEGIPVMHIHEDAGLETNEELDKRVLVNFERKMKMDIDQIGFLEPERSLGEWIAEAYRLRNREIGYRITAEE